MNRVLDLIKLARELGASDLHLIAGLPPAVRLHGTIQMSKSDSIDRQSMKEIVMETLSEEQQEQLKKEKELCFSIFDHDSGRIRITAYYHAGIPELAIRLCSLEIPDGRALGLPEVMDDLVRKTSGLILVTGPTGAGKTTTLNYLIDVINRERRCKIVTIEDPVEFVHKPIRSLIVQQEVHTDTLSYSKALVHVLRQNPDVIVVGEMRDTETISTAIQAAETGHLVLATLHTPNVVQSVERITGPFPSNQKRAIVMELANSLQAIITQNLVPRSDGQGCVLAYELLVATSGVRNIIRENNLHLLYSAVETGRKKGMRTMDDSLRELYQKALITFDAAVSRARNPKKISPDAPERATTSSTQYKSIRQ